MPALANTTSTRPNASTTASKARSTAAPSLTSQAKASAPSGATPRRDSPATCHPSASARDATASPIPEDAPVTTITAIRTP